MAGRKRMNLNLMMKKSISPRLLTDEEFLHLKIVIFAISNIVMNSMGD